MKKLNIAGSGFSELKINEKKDFIEKIIKSQNNLFGTKDDLFFSYVGYDDVMIESQTDSVKNITKAVKIFKEKYKCKIIQSDLEYEDLEEEKGLWIPTVIVNLKDFDTKKLSTADVHSPFLYKMNDTGKKYSAMGVVKYIDSMTDKAIDLKAVKEKVVGDSAYWGETEIPVKHLIVEDEKEVTAELDLDREFNDKDPIVVDKKGWVIDGRHRTCMAKALKRNTIKAIVPITK